MREDDAAKKALLKLDWIAKLSKTNCPGGAPKDMPAMRALLNRIVLDVRAACALLSGAGKSAETGANGKRKTRGAIPKHGGYRKLKSFQVAEIVYDGTRIFCDRFVDRRSRTHDQMVQAGRSGRQNIAEGSMASATSKKAELKLTNVAKSSLEELLLDFEDYLRQDALRRWDKNDPEALAVRGRYKEFPEEWFSQSDVSDESDESDGSDTSDKSDESDKRELLDPYGIADAAPETAANTLICLINKATYLLKRQIEKLEQDFLEKGGFTENLYQARVRRRQNQQS